MATNQDTATTSPFNDDLMDAVRARFLHVDRDPIAGERIYFENGGGSLTLASVIERSAELMAYPDSASRRNPTAGKLAGVIAQAGRDIRCFFGAGEDGQIIAAATGTDLIFRLVRTALQATKSGSVLSSALEHPCSYDAAQMWAERQGRNWIEVPLDPATANVSADAYARLVRPDTAVATVIHTSHVTGMRVDVAAVAGAIRATAPDCFIICDGIQHAPHGSVDVAALDVDAYVFAPYKAMSRHGSAYAWLSPRLARIPHDKLRGRDADNWDLGQRDPAVLAAQSEVHGYLCWLGGHFTNSSDQRARVVAAMNAANRHELHLIDLLINGRDGLPGLTDLAGVSIIGGTGLASREGAVSFTVEGRVSADVVADLGRRAIRVHDRRDDPFSGHILQAFALPDCVRVSFCHYNTTDEVAALLHALPDML
jgi:selenocysteine lyase/cysteine desulfurase